MIADLHVHTNHSFDSLADPKAVLRVAHAKGLNAIAITDHNTITGAFATRSLAAGFGLQVIVGEEIATDRGDVVALFLDSEVRPGPLTVVVEEVHSQGGLIVLPHPYRSHRVTVDLVAASDLIEEFNARTMPELNAAATALARAQGKHAIAVSDAHFPAEIGNSGIVANVPDLREALGRGAFTLIEKYNPPYLQPASQMIKSVKLRTYGRIPRLAAKTFLTLFRPW